MLQPIDSLALRRQERLAQLQEMRQVGTAGLAHLATKLAAAHAQGDMPRAEHLRAEIETIETWLVWAAAKERQEMAATALILVPERDAAAGPR